MNKRQKSIKIESRACGMHFLSNFLLRKVLNYKKEWNMKKIFLLVALFNLIFSPVCLAELVMYNTQTGKFHSIHCRWAQKCTVNCIKIERAAAIKRGGVPCKVCGG